MNWKSLRTHLLLALVPLGGMASFSACGTQRSSLSERTHPHPTPAALWAEAEMIAASDRGEPDFAVAKKSFDTDAYDHVVENRFVSARLAPFSTFSVDVDTASYSTVRGFLEAGSRPPASAVRIEELLNYFDYDYGEPSGDQPFVVHTEVAPAPWAPEHRLLHIGLKTRSIPLADLPPRNLVFLIDVSGSMDAPNRLPLLERSFAALLETLREQDTVSIVVYAGASGLVLPPTPGHRRGEILGALDRLEAGGSTNGGDGIVLAYDVAQRSARPGSVNRVILATDGDFNVGVTSQSELVSLIERKRDTGVFLTVLGYGMGNYKDSTLEKLADRGNGNYAYIDTLREARKVLVEEGGANLVTVAKDAKIQVEFNPRWVGAYRLIGYENRALATEDFKDDRKDAGEVGAGHTVTALYELMSPDEAARVIDVDTPKYTGATPTPIDVPELGTVKLRYKEPAGATSRLLDVPVRASTRRLDHASESFRFAAAVASFGMLLRNSEHRGTSSYALATELARGGLGHDRGGHRSEFLELVAKAESLQE